MREHELARVLLVRACEESDPEGRFLPLAARERSDAATPPLPPPELELHAAEEWLVHRAEPLARRLTEAHAALRSALSLAPLRLPVPAIAGLALLLGLGVDALGAERRINLLSFPLLGLILWNLGVYAFAIARRVLPGAGRPARERVTTALARASAWLAAPDRPWLASPRGAAEATWVTRSLRRFFALWLDAARPLLAARTECALHLGAVAFALGVVLGMYLRGLAFEYRAGWESTFLSPAQVHAVLGFVLGPAARLLDAVAPGLDPSARSLLAVDSLEALRERGGAAAPWIHLWAITTGLAIGLPRLVLAGLAAHRARRLAGALHVSAGEPWALRRLAARRGRGLRVDLVPYSHRPSPRAQQGARALLLELFGNRATLCVADPVAYGAEAEELPVLAAPPASGPHCTALLFNLAQTPEQEVHGGFLETVKHAVAERPPGSYLLVLLDEEPYRGVAEPARLGERRRAWRRLARDCGLTAVALGAMPHPSDDELAASREALWPREAA